MLSQPPSFNEEVLNFLATSPTPHAIIAFRPSDALKERSYYLLEQKHRGELSEEERAELTEFLRLQHFMNMLKNRARKFLPAAELALPFPLRKKLF